MNDLYHDTAHSVLAGLLTRHPGVTDLVKSAEFEDDPATIPSGAFAWKGERLFPLHTPEHAVLSYLYAKHAHENGVKTASHERVPEYVLKELEDALDVYGINRAALAPVQEKVAAYAPEDCIFPERLMYPVRNAGEIKLAEDALTAQVSRMRPETRTRAFSKLAEAARRYGVTLKTASAQWAGAAFTNRAPLADHLDARALMAKGEHRTSYQKLAQAVREGKGRFFSPALQEKFAAAIERLDESAALQGEYDREIPDARRTVFNGQQKFASALRVGDNVVDGHGLMALPVSFYKDALDPGIEGDITSGGKLDSQKLAAVLATLPADMGAEFCRHAKNAGVRVQPA